MLNQLNPFYFAEELHNSALDFIIANMPLGISSENISNLIYDFFAQRKSSDENFFHFTPTIKSSFSLAFNSLNSQPPLVIPNSFNTVLNAFPDPLNHAAELKVLATSLATNLLVTEIPENEKVIQMIGLAIYPESVLYWKDVKDNVANPWHIWAEAQGGAEVFFRLNLPEVARKDILGGISGLFGGVLRGTTGDDLVKNVLYGCIAGSAIEIINQVFL